MRVCVGDCSGDENIELLDALNNLKKHAGGEKDNNTTNEYFNMDAKLCIAYTQTKPPEDNRCFPLCLRSGDGLAEAFGSNAQSPLKGTHHSTAWSVGGKRLNRPKTVSSLAALAPVTD